MKNREKDIILDYLIWVKNDILKTIEWARREGYSQYAETYEKDLWVVKRLIEEYKRKDKR